MANAADSVAAMVVVPGMSHKVLILTMSNPAVRSK